MVPSELHIDDYKNQESFQSLDFPKTHGFEHQSFLWRTELVCVCCNIPAQMRLDTDEDTKTPLSTMVESGYGCS